MREGKQGRTSHRDYPNNSLEYEMPVYGRKRYTMANPIRDNLRNRYMTAVREFLPQAGEEVLETNSNEFAIPCVDEKGNDEFIVVSFKIPVGSRDGDPYDGYSMAEDYAMKKAEKAEKAAAAAEKKRQKMEKDAARRAKKESSKEAHARRMEEKDSAGDSAGK